ncbi:hypothetical protein LguiA_016304 [Lonicera macranthoides]
MEGRKQVGSSSSSFTSDLFGSEDSSGSSPSTGIFSSIFAPSPKVFGMESVGGHEVFEKKQDSPSSVWTIKPGGLDGSRQGESQNQQKRESSVYYEEKVQPCHLSSSIYYGGQDNYSHPKSSQNSGYSTFNKDGGEDDSGAASRGNWWQGSLYY